MEGAHDRGLALEKVLPHPSSASQPLDSKAKWAESEARTFSPRMSCTPLSTSARDRYPFPLGSNCRKSSSRRAFSESLFPIGSFAAHTLHDTQSHPHQADTVSIAARHRCTNLKSLLLPAMPPLPFCCAPEALPADPGVVRRGASGPGVRRGGSGLAPCALVPWPTGLGVAPSTLLPRPAAAAAAAAAGLTPSSA